MEIITDYYEEVHTCSAWQNAELLHAELGNKKLSLCCKGWQNNNQIKMVVKSSPWLNWPLRNHEKKKRNHFYPTLSDIRNITALFEVHILAPYFLNTEVKGSLLILGRSNRCLYLSYIRPRIFSEIHWLTDWIRYEERKNRGRNVRYRTSPALINIQ
jgi:hypothetical protein